MDVVAAAEPLSFSANAPAWLLMGCAVMAVMYMMMRPRKRDPLAGGGIVRSSLAQQKALERDMQNVIVELSELTRSMSAQLETRAAKLEILIHDADGRIAALARANADAPVAPPVTGPILATAAEPVRSMRLVQDSEDRWNDVYRHADEGASITEICRSLNRPRGEVELIMALRPKPRHAESAVAVG